MYHLTIQNAKNKDFKSLYIEKQTNKIGNVKKKSKKEIDIRFLTATLQFRKQ